MTGSEKDATVGLVLSDDVGGSRGGENAVLSDDELCDAIGRADLEDGLDGLWREVATVTADNEGLALGVDRVKDGLDEVFCVVLERR